LVDQPGNKDVSQLGNKEENASVAAMGARKGLALSEATPEELAAQESMRQEAEVAAQLRAAYVELNFDHGYPAMPGGMPFWFKFDFEAGFAFAAFQMYLEMGEGGPRKFHELCLNGELLAVARNQADDPELTSAVLNLQLQEYFILHYWYARSKAFDLYREAALRHQRLRRQETTEEKHFNVAASLLEKLSAYFLTERFMDEMTPKAALDAFSKIVAIQRVSVGLPASGPLDEMKAGQQATSFEMIMRNVAKKNNAGSALGSDFGAGTSHTREMLDQILLDPMSAANLQEVIIRVSQVATNADQLPERRFPGRRKDIPMVDTVDVAATELKQMGANPNG
jgi:hypothetical protein